MNMGNRESKSLTFNTAAVYISPGIYLTAERNPGKPQLGDC
jgi:hypothetical protein